MPTSDHRDSSAASAAGGLLAGIGLSGGWGALVLAMIVGVAVTAALLLALLFFVDPVPMLGLTGGASGQPGAGPAGPDGAADVEPPSGSSQADSAAVQAPQDTAGEASARPGLASVLGLGASGPPPGLTADQCQDVPQGGALAGPDCVTRDIACGQTLVDHTRGGVNRYDTRFYERNACWPATRDHSGGDERVYRFIADDTPRFQAGEQRQRVTVYFDSPCADLTFTKMLGQSPDACPDAPARLCDSANPFYREAGSRNIVNLTVDRGEVYYFVVEGADDAEGAFAITLECGT